MATDLSEAFTMPLPHTTREHAKAAPRRAERFATGGGGSSLPPDFVSQLVAASDDGDEYDPRLAYALSVVAGWSYSDAETLANKLKYYAMPDVTVDKVMVVNPAMLIVASAFLVRSACGRLGLLAFRGTEPTNAINWLTDTDVVQRAFGRGCVHQGFYANLQAVWEEIATLLRDAMKTGPGSTRAALDRLYVTGHSLGGAMAVLGAARLTIDEDPTFGNLVRGVYTFGQPAVGNRAFTEDFAPRFGDRLFRHSYAYDVVPQLPPAWSDRFVHFGTEYVTTGKPARWVQGRGRTQATWIVPAVASCAASFVTRRLPLLEYAPLPYSLDDHSPTRYIEASRQALEPA